MTAKKVTMAADARGSVPKKKFRARSPKEIVYHREVITDMYLRKHLHMDEIAEELGISVSTVSRDLSIMIDEWQANATEAIEQHIAEELERINGLEKTYWEAWYNSLEDEEVLTQKAVGSGRKEVTKRKKDQRGDPRFLAGVQWCIEQRCKLLGISAPNRLELTGKGGNELTITLKSGAEGDAAIDPDKL